MPQEPENLVLQMLCDIRVKQEDLFARLEAVETRVRRVESHLDDLRMTVTYALGQSTETRFKQSKQGARIDALFAQMEKLVTARNRSHEIPPHLLVGSTGKRSVAAAG